MFINSPYLGDIFEKKIVDQALILDSYSIKFFMARFLSSTPPSFHYSKYTIDLYSYLNYPTLHMLNFQVKALVQRRGVDYFLTKIWPQVLQSTMMLGTNAYVYTGTMCLVQ